MAEVPSTQAAKCQSPGSIDDLPVKRSFFAAFIAAVIGVFSIGYANGFPSTALIDFGRLPDSRALKTASLYAQLFVVSRFAHSMTAWSTCLTHSNSADTTHST